MNLHQNRDDFIAILNASQAYFKIPLAALEKDYYVTLFLYYLIKEDNDFIFKGGTCLQKFFHIIERFSEDIDLSYPYSLLTVGRRKRIKQEVLSSGLKCGFEITNLDKTRSRRAFNSYKFDYPKTYHNDLFKPLIEVETAFQSDCYPFLNGKIGTLIGTFLKETNRNDLILKYNLDEFEVKVQALERTFIDKIFAIADYHISKKITRQSRHIYDLSKIYPLIKLDDEFLKLFIKVRDERRKNETCYSAKEGQILTNLIDELILEDTYKDDYINNGSLLLWEKVTYEEVIESLKGINEKLKIILKNID